MKTILATFMGVLIAAQLTAQAPTSLPEKPEVVFVAGGTFKMGSNSGSRNETPVHSVTIDAFSIGKYEVTVGQYKMYCNATGCSMPSAPKWGWQDRHPMVNVNYREAVAYCNWLGEKFGGDWHLPTEAEWEYAARGGNKSRGFNYSGSDDFETVGWFSNNAGGQTMAVGLKKPNELGLHDMSGNVWEICQDWYGESYYAESPGSNPQGPSSGSERVERGGCWSYNAEYLRVAYRTCVRPFIRDFHRGFRVVLSQ